MACAAALVQSLHRGSLRRLRPAALLDFHGDVADLALLSAARLLSLPRNHNTPKRKSKKKSSGGEAASMRLGGTSVDAPEPAVGASPPPAQPAGAAAAPGVRTRECCVCLDDVPSQQLLLLWPCAHRCVCARCAEALQALPPPDRRCPKCRNPFTAASRVYED